MAAGDGQLTALKTQFIRPWFGDRVLTAPRNAISNTTTAELFENSTTKRLLLL